MAKVTADVSGLKNVMGNLNLAIKAIGGGTYEGMVEASNRILEETLPITPHSGSGPGTRVKDGGTYEGMVEASNRILEETLPITPHSGSGPGTRVKAGGKGLRGGGGNLRNTGFTDTERRGKKIVSRVGFHAPYAAWVHEMDPDVNWTTPGTGNKFLEKAVRRNIRNILQIIRAHAKVK